MKTRHLVLLIISMVMALSLPLHGQRSKKATAAKSETELITPLLSNLSYRHIGPFRGGRASAVTGVTGSASVFYQGATGGGVWKTTDGGITWKNISDGYFGGTIGSIAVAPSDPNIIYAGGGEKSVRGNVSHGYGIWKSLDAGETWNYVGLKEGQYIPRMRVHPTNPDIVYAAVLGHIFGPNEERGVYRSNDGGTTWKRVLFVSNEAGAHDLILDPTNPRVIYATTWKVKRTPYSLESGGEGSGLWKSTDGGDTWKEISRNQGLPKGTLGIIGVTVSPINNKRVWAIVEAADGGLFRSEDGGNTWRRVSDDRNIRQRAWYYSRIYADPGNEDGIYVLNVQFFRSKDGGSSFERISTPHGDHHDLWVSPVNPQIMAVADDGGAQISLNGGTSWSTMMNQPTAQFYRVATDNHFPYRIYVAQQDNSTLRIASRSFGNGITEDDWEETAGGESGWIAPDPNDPEIVYGGSYGGYLERNNHRTGERRMINPWPDNPMGWGAAELTYRFQWNFPILFSKHDNGVLYSAANVLFKTANEGQSWEVISPDLTRNDKSKMESSGGPITKDNTSVEYYGTIFAVAESSIEKGVIWTGSDDGLINITRDNGNTWTNVTPTNLLPKWTMINSVEADPFNSGGLYVAATSYKSDDFKPYLLRTTDYGKNWTLIAKGIAADHFTRVIRADSKRQGLLFAGTESGIYISLDNGDNWGSFQMNLPIVPITDLEIKGNDLIVATQGRSLWIFGHVDIIRQLNTNVSGTKALLFDPPDAYRISGRRGGGLFSGENPSPGAEISFYLDQEPDDKNKVTIELFTSDGDLVRSFESDIKRNDLKNHLPNGLLEAKKGINHLSWDLSWPGAMQVPGMILWGGNLSGPRAVPGTYKVRLTAFGETMEKELTLLPNPLSSSSVNDLQEQFDLLISIRDKLTETHQAIIDIRSLNDQLSDLIKKLDGNDHSLVIKEIKGITGALTTIEEALYQTKNRSSQDPLNFPIKLNNKLAGVASVAGSGDWKPTEQSIKVAESLIAEIDIELKKFEEIKTSGLNNLNVTLKDAKVPFIKF